MGAPAGLRIGWSRRYGPPPKAKVSSIKKGPRRNDGPSASGQAQPELGSMVVGGHHGPLPARPTHRQLGPVSWGIELHASNFPAAHSVFSLPSFNMGKLITK